MKKDELPPGWAWATLGEIGVEAQPGFASGRHNQDADGVIHLRPMNISREGKIDLTTVKYVHDTSDRRVNDGDVLFNNTNSPELVGKTALVRSPMPIAYSNHMTRLRPPSFLLSQFLAYQLHYLWSTGYFRSVLNNHVNQASVSRKILLGTYCVLPPLAEQERIVDALEDHLSRLDVAQTSLESGRLRMLALERSISESMRSKCSGSPVRELGELFREPLRNGHSARAATGSDGGIRTLTLTAVTKNEFSDRYTKLTDADPGKVSNLWLEPGDILIQRSNTPDLVGTSAIYDGPENWAIYPDLLIRVRMNDEVIPSFVALMLSSPSVRRYFKSRAKGLAGSMPKIDQSTIAKVRMPVPSIECQQEILFESRELLEQLDRTSRDLRTAQRRGSALRSAMLRTAFGGKLVSQEPADEPALTLLERIKAERASQPKPTRKRSAKTATASTRPAPATSSDPAGTYVQEELGL